MSNGDDTPQANAQNDLPPPSWSAYNPQELIKIINAGATKYGPSHPQYGQARALMQQARAELARQMHVQNAADSAAVGQGSMAPPPQLPPGALGAGIAGIENFGQGASLGAFSQNSPIPGAQGAIDPQFLAAARTQHPLASMIGEGAGVGADMLLASQLAPVLRGVLGQTLLGGGFGATQGAMESKNRGLGAVLGGVGGATGGALGAAAGKIAGLGVKAGQQIGAKILGKPAAGALSKEAAAAAQAIGVNISKEGEEEVGGMAVSKLRTTLAKQNPGLPPEQIENMINATRKATTRVQSGGVTQETKDAPTFVQRGGKVLPDAAVDPQLSVARIQEGAKPTRTPTQSPLEAIQARLDMARAKAATHTAESILPQPSGAVTLTEKGVAPAPVPEAWQAARQVSAPIAELQERLGRALTPQELEKVHETLAQGAARNAYNVSEGIGRSKADATAAARRAAGTVSTPWDPRIGL